MKILITGAAGFVGAYAIRQLAESGSEIHAAILPQEQLAADLLPLCTVHHFDLLDAEGVRARLSDMSLFGVPVP